MTKHINCSGLITGRHFHYLWEKAKNNDLNGLNDEDRRLAEAMLMHEEEFFNEFEFADVLHFYNLSKLRIFSIQFPIIKK